MFKKIVLPALLIPAFYFSNAQTKKFDTTLKMGDVGYRVICSNKKMENNDVSIKPIGFKNSYQDINLAITGPLKKAIVDDFNNDGFPDLLFYSTGDNEKAQIYAMASVANKSCAPIYMPDVYIDPKLRDGYKGYDELSSMGGFLIRKFPIYQTDSTTKNTSIIGTRVIEYKAKSNSPNTDNPIYKFEVFKSYDIKQ
jgi:hypothetical protein